VVTTSLADPQETDNAPYANLDPITGSPLPSGPVASPLTFYLHDHLGNTRVLFRADAPGAYAIDYAADYLPFGKVLREYPACNRDRFLSTHHERDAATGYDNRGARMYDGEIGRFLGVDPLAGSFAGWSPYNYVLGNPVSLIDPDGAEPQGPIYGSNGRLIGYMVEPGQGPTQIAQDINENYSCQMSCGVNYQDIVVDNAGSFANVIDGSGTPLGKLDDAYKSGNINPGDVLLIAGGSQSGEEVGLIVVSAESFQKKADSVQGIIQKKSIWLTGVSMNNDMEKMHRMSPDNAGAGVGGATALTMQRLTGDTTRERRVQKGFEGMRDSVLGIAEK
jgi:RHS repeat-associated protein